MTLRYPVLACLLIGSVFSPVVQAETQESPASPGASPTVEAEEDSANAAAPATATPGTLVATLDLPTDFQQTAALWALLAGADLEQVERLIEEAHTVANANDRAVALSVCYQRFLDLDPVAAADHLLASADPSQHLVYMLFNSWAKFAVDPAVQYANRMNRPSLRPLAVRGIMQANPNQDIESLRRLAQRLGPSAEQALAGIERQRLLELVVHDPDAALEALNKVPMQQQYSLAHQLGQQLAQLDPKSALEFADRVQQANSRRLIRMAAFGAMAQSDPGGTLALLEELELDHEQRQELINATVQALAQGDPRGAVFIIDRLEEPAEREQALMNLLMNTSHSAPEVAFDILSSIDEPRLLNQHGQMVLHSLGQQDPERAMAFAREHADLAPQLMHGAISGIAQNEPLRALQLAEELPDSALKTSLVSDAFAQYAGSDPESALELVEAMPPGPQRQVVIQRMAQVRFESDPQGTLDWVFGLPPRECGAALQGMAWRVARYDTELARSLVPELPSVQLQAEWVGTILQNSMERESPLATAAWLEPYAGLAGYEHWVSQLATASVGRGQVQDALDILDLIEEPAARDIALSQLVNTWAYQDPRAAADFLLSDEGRVPDRSQAIRSVTESWAQQDFRAAQTWVLGIDDSLERDQGLSALLNPDLVTDQEAAVLYRKIYSDDARQAALRNYVFSVARYDTDAAIRFVRGRNLFVDEESALIEALETGSQSVGFMP